MGELIATCFRHHHLLPCGVCERRRLALVTPITPQQFLPSRPDPDYFRDVFNETKRWLDVE